MPQLGTSENPLLVAIVGSGPSGFYAAEALIRSELNVKVDMLERLPAPYGLVRHGVAPDHPKLKQAILLYDKIANAEEFNLVGNVTVGRDISIEELKQSHHAVILTYGAETDRKLGIPGEDLNGSYTATEFVGWYNGHPDYRNREFNLSHEVAVIIGQGNVAADVARILAKTVDELKNTDIAQHALDVLAESKIKDIYVIGRRGPAQAKFTPKELREFGELSDCSPVIVPDELVLNAESEKELEEKTNIANAKIYQQFKEYADRPSSNKTKRCHFQFLRSPVELSGKNNLEKVKLEHNQLSGEPFAQSARGSGKTYDLDTGILFRSIGYRGISIPGVPFNENWGVIQNQSGRVIDNDKVVSQLYTAGWIKRGPTGIIGTNRACAVETVNALVEDIEKKSGDAIKPGINAIYPLLEKRGIKYINYSDWKKIDAREIQLGEAREKPREKFTKIEEMLAILN